MRQWIVGWCQPAFVRLRDSAPRTRLAAPKTGLQYTRGRRGVEPGTRRTSQHIVFRHDAFQRVPSLAQPPLARDGRIRAQGSQLEELAVRPVTSQVPRTGSATSAYGGHGTRNLTMDAEKPIRVGGDSAPVAVFPSCPLPISVRESSRADHRRGERFPRRLLSRDRDHGRWEDRAQE